MKNKKFVAEIRSSVRRYFGDEEFSKKELPQMVKAITAVAVDKLGLSEATDAILAAAAQGGFDLTRKRDGRAILLLLQQSLETPNPAIEEYRAGKIGFKDLQKLLASKGSCCGGCHGPAAAVPEADDDDVVDYPYASISAEQLEAWRLEVRTPKYVKINVIQSVSSYHFNVTRYGHAIGLVRVIEQPAGPAFVCACHVGPSTLHPPLPTLEDAMKSIVQQYENYRGK